MVVHQFMRQTQDGKVTHKVNVVFNTDDSSFPDCHECGFSGWALDVFVFDREMPAGRYIECPRCNEIILK